jgi:hypothetical protein
MGTSREIKEAIDLKNLLEIIDDLFILSLAVIFTKSRFGNPVLQIGNKRFNKHSRCRDKFKARWICTRTGSGCRATVTTIDDVIISINGIHNH